MDSILSSDILTTLTESVPKLLVAFILLLFGWLIALLLQRTTKHLVQLSWRYSQKFSVSQTDTLQRMPREGRHYLAKIVFWLTMIIFINFTATTLEFTIFSKWVNTFLSYVPNLLLALIIIIASFVVGELLRDLIANANSLGSTKAGPVSTAARANQIWLGRLSQSIVIGTGILIGISQLGVDVTLLTNITTMAFGALFGAFAIGLALGAPTHVSNFMGARYVQRLFQPGDHIRIRRHQGTIIEISTYSVILETETGQLHLPAKLFVETPCEKLILDDAEKPNQTGKAH